MLSDLRDAFRQLTKSPGFTVVIVLTLGLGIGANTAIFSFFYGILLRPLPFDAPDRIAQVRQRAGQPVDAKFSSGDFLALGEARRSIEQVAAYSTEIATLTGRGEPDALFCAVVSRNFFSSLGARPHLGRVFQPEDFSGDASPARFAILSHGCWRDHFSGDPEVIGQSVVFNGVSFTILGVMPAGFQFPRWIEAWFSPAGNVPEPAVAADAAEEIHDGDRYLGMIARVREGMSFREAEAELTQLMRLSPDPDATPIELSIRLDSMRERTIGNARSALAMLLGCVGLVLLIACVNIASLLLSRATTRQREMGIRAALGGSRKRIARQLLTEGLLLAGLGGVIGVLIGVWATELLLTLAPTELPRLSEVRLDGWAVAFAAGVSVLTGIACGLAPVWHATALDLTQLMKGDDRTSSGSRTGMRMRSALVAAEIAVSLVLMLAAGLLLRSFWRIATVDLGLEPQGVVTARVVFATPEYASESRQITLYHDVRQRVATLHGVESVALCWDQPVNETWMHERFAADTGVPLTPEQQPYAAMHTVSPDYFRTLRIPLLKGRAFNEADDENAVPVVLVNTTLARQFFPDGDALGKHLRLGARTDVSVRAEIVGVVADVRHDGPELESGYNIYRPYPQAPLPSFFVIMRTSMDVATAHANLTGIVRSFDPTLPVSYAADLAETVAWPGVKRRFSLVLVAMFAGLALVLAAVGIYGVTSHAVAQRTREIGIRMALGAQRGEVVKLVLKHGLRIVGAGIALGLAGGGIAAFLLQRLLFDTSSFDPLTFVAMPLLIAVVAILACWLPAREATNVDPTHAVRVE